MTIQSRAANGQFAEKEGEAPEVSLAEDAVDDERICGVDFDHDENVTYEDDDLIQWTCRTCGAEGEIDLSE